MRWVLFLLIIYTSIGWGQKSYYLKVESTTAENPFTSIYYKPSFSNTKEREKEIQNLLLHLYDNAYLSASIDSILYSTPVPPNKFDTAYVYVNAGAPYKWAYLKKGNIDKEIMQEAGFREKYFFEKSFSYKEIKNIQEKILTYYENNGYPFAFIKLDSIYIEKENISAVLNLQKNNLVKVDSIVNRGDGKIAPTYLQNYLGIRNGSLYNEEYVKNIGARIKQLPFLTERIPYRVLFQGEKAKIELFLEKKQASQFDGIIGLLPNNKTGKLLFTGDVLLKLNNAFTRGELLELNWRRLQAATQDLKARFILPFLLKSPFGADLNFKLYKKDSTFLEVNPNIGIQYQLIGGNYFKAFVNQRQMTLINTTGLKYITTLPAYADVSTSLYGVSIKSEKLNYNINPRRGYSFTGTVSAGNRVIKKNDKLNEAVYDNLKLRSVQYSSEIEAMLFIPIKNRGTIKIGNQSAWLENSTLFLNDLYRIGGLKTLRGFDEESILASIYSIFTLEYRFLFEENSYLFFFSDAAYYENRGISFSGDRYDAPYSIGTGISFQTKAGIFSINYALGSQYGNAIDLRRGKVHFGIVSHF